MPARATITGVVLAGGQGVRMGGADKGLQVFGGETLAGRALRRLQPQVGALMVSANRNLGRYAALGVPVWPDDLPGHAGPLAGFATALRHCDTDWLVTVPCDVPAFPVDLVSRLSAALEDGGHLLAVAEVSDTRHAHSAAPRAQPVFCLMAASLRTDLENYLAEGGRKVGAWVDRNGSIRVRFDAPGAFRNINSTADLTAAPA